ncbi:response regulator [Streptomyces sp. C11-1]|uniref:response regulator transcription factor n=1 Tax=Streptomyces sp. C11-1 TaxID=3444503 RepID=UPI0037DA1E26
MRRRRPVTEGAGSCRACGRALPPARKAGRPCRYCSSTCQSAGRRARARDAALLPRRGGPCTAQLAGRRSPKPAAYTLFVSEASFPFCSASYTVTAQYLLDQRIPASDLVTVELPGPPGPAVPEPVRTSPKDEGPVRRTRLLLVEDDDAIREALRFALTRRGYEVQAEGTGRAGLRSAYPQHPDPVLLDVTLPDINGMEVPHRAAHHQRCPRHLPHGPE